MGRRVVALAATDPDITITHAVDHPQNDAIGTDAGMLAGVNAIGVPLSSEWPRYAAAVIDFSLPSAADAVIARCVEHGLPLVMATTGLTEFQMQAIDRAAEEIAVVQAPSMSMAVNLTMKAAAKAAAVFKDAPGGLDVEIIERHHRFKADAPSGTALRFGELIAQSISPENPGKIRHVHGRHGETGRRTRDEIGYHAVRVADNPGEHTILFGLMGERLEMNVAASNRDCYAAGAIAAAKWLQGRPAGRYDMFDVLGLSD